MSMHTTRGGQCYLMSGEKKSVLLLLKSASYFKNFIKMSYSEHLSQFFGNNMAVKNLPDLLFLAEVRKDFQNPNFILFKSCSWSVSFVYTKHKGCRNC